MVTTHVFIQLTPGEDCINTFITVLTLWTVTTHLLIQVIPVEYCINTFVPIELTGGSHNRGWLLHNITHRVVLQIHSTLNSALQEDCRNTIDLILIYMVKVLVFILLMPVEDCIIIFVITLTRVFIKPTSGEDCINTLVPTLVSMDTNRVFI